MQVLHAVAGSKRREWPLVKLKTYLRSYFWPYWILLLVVNTFGAMFFTNSSDWGNSPSPGYMAAVCALIMLVWLVGGVGGAIVGLGTWNDSKRLYRERLSASPAATPLIQIEARVGKNDGRILIYEISKSITGSSEKFLKHFDPEDVEAIHEYVTVERKRVDPYRPELDEAKMLVRTINEGRWEGNVRRRNSNY